MQNLQYHISRECEGMLSLCEVFSLCCQCVNAVTTVFHNCAACNKYRKCVDQTFRLNMLVHYAHAETFSFVSVFGRKVLRL